MKRLWYVSVLLVALLLASCGGVIIVGGGTPTAEVPYVESGVAYVQENTRNLDELVFTLEDTQDYRTRYVFTGTCIVAKTDYYRVDDVAITFQGGTTQFVIYDDELTALSTTSFSPQQSISPLPTVDCTLYAEAIWTERDGVRYDKNTNEVQIFSGRVAPRAS